MELLSLEIKEKVWEVEAEQATEEEYKEAQEDVMPCDLDHDPDQDLDLDLELDLDPDLDLDLGQHFQEEYFEDTIFVALQGGPVEPEQVIEHSTTEDIDQFGLNDFRQVNEEEGTRKLIQWTRM